MTGEAGPAAHLDVAVIGGGIAGLWLLDALHRAGYRTALFEAAALGGGQTLSSQGIIHSGAKYALGGKPTGNRARLASMPARWLAAVTGGGAPDLSSAPAASDAQFLLLPRSLRALAAGIFGRAVLADVFSPLARTDWPLDIAGTGFRGTVIRLGEPVLDLPAIVARLAASHRDRIRQGGIEPAAIQAGGPYRIGPSGAAVTARRLVVTAGAGNAALGPALSPDAAAQERPLRMVLLRGALPRLFAHIDIRRGRPALTITSHRPGPGGGSSNDGDAAIWYIGGDIAEIGVRLNDTDLLAETRRRLARYFPALPLDGVEGATHAVSRHEAATPDRHLPDGPVIRGDGDALVAWPTKLAYAPLLADAILDRLPPPTGGAASAPPLPGAPPAIAPPPWETAEWRPLS